MSVNVLIEFFSEELKQLSHKATGDKMAAYMKGHFPFYGVNAPARKEIVTRIWQSEKAVINNQIRPLVKAMWSKEHRENQMIALDLMGRCKKQFTEDDLPFVESLITTKSWWDTVDFLASTSIGYILQRDKVLATDTARRYMNNENMWLQRTALIFQLKYKEDTDAHLLYELIDKTKGSKEFFINKASGWALRQYSKFDPEGVKSYISDNETKLARLTIREGSKYL